MFELTQVNKDQQTQHLKQLKTTGSSKIHPHNACQTETLEITCQFVEYDFDRTNRARRKLIDTTTIVRHTTVVSQGREKMKKVSRTHSKRPRSHVAAASSAARRLACTCACMPAVCLPVRAPVSSHVSSAFSCRGQTPTSRNSLGQSLWTAHWLLRSPIFPRRSSQRLPSPCLRKK